MPAMTKQQYWDAGRKASEAGQKPAALKAGTWQAAAYNRGFAGVPLGDAPEVVKAPTHLPNNVRPVPPKPAAAPLYAPGRMIGKSHTILSAALTLATDGWPSAPREHARLLIREMQTEKDARRRVRLVTALQRMARRHGRGARVQCRIVGFDEAAGLDMAISTVPHPDGPITVRQILSGD